MDKPIIIDLPKFLDRRGNLSFAEQLKHVPFEIRRTYWIYDVPGGESPGGRPSPEPSTSSSPTDSRHPPSPSTDPITASTYPKATGAR